MPYPACIAIVEKFTPSQGEQQAKRSRLCKKLFARQDDIEIQHNTLIEQLEDQLEQWVQERVLFAINGSFYEQINNQWLPGVAI